MAISTAIPVGCKYNLLTQAATTTQSWAAGGNNKIGLFKSSVGRTYDGTVGTANATLAYIQSATSDEASVVGGTGGYSAGGTTVDEAAVVESSSTAYCDFTNDPQWTIVGAGTLASDGAFIYDDDGVTPTDPIWSYHSYATATASGDTATFTIQAPAAAEGTAIIRLA